MDHHDVDRHRAQALDAARPEAVAKQRRRGHLTARERVASLFDVGTFDSGLPYMVMELLRGEDLSQLLTREGRLPLEDAVDYRDVLGVVVEIGEGRRFDLLEAFATALAETLLERFAVSRVRVRVRKPDVVLERAVEHAAVVVERVV